LNKGERLETNVYSMGYTTKECRHPARGGLGAKTVYRH